jgi:hypothetical protein
MRMRECCARAAACQQHHKPTEPVVELDARQLDAPREASSRARSGNPRRHSDNGIRRLDDRGVRARDLAEIEKLHRKDVEATLAGDQAALGEGMTDDIVILQQGQEPEIGKQATLEARRKNAKPGFRVLSYATDIKDVTFTDGWASPVMSFCSRAMARRITRFTFGC